MADFDELGRQVPDPRPVEAPTGLNRPLTIHEEIKRFVRVELSARAAAGGVETFEEADDFDLEEDPDVVPLTAYEMQAEQIDRDASDLARPEPPLPPGKPAGDPAIAGTAVPGASAPAQPPVVGAVPPSSPPGANAPVAGPHSAT